MKDKKVLVRVACTQDGGLTVDSIGKNPGRGAYICRDELCLAKALKTKGLERSLKRGVSPEIYEQLKIEIAEIEAE